MIVQHNFFLVTSSSRQDPMEHLLCYSLDLTILTFLADQHKLQTCWHYLCSASFIAIVYIFLFYYCFLYLRFTCQDYFIDFKLGQLLGGGKTEDPDLQQAELGLSHMWLELGSNPQWWDDERFRVLKISGLHHSTRKSLVYNCFIGRPLLQSNDVLANMIMIEK